MQRGVLLLAMALVAAACGAGDGIPDQSSLPPLPSLPDTQLEALADARELWAAAAPADYTVTQRDEDGAPQTVAVHEGEIVSLASVDPPTVEDVFGTIEDSLRDGAEVDVEYHPEYGYPVRVVIDLDGDGTPDVDLHLSDLEAMPIVRTLDELRQAKRRWEALGLDTYRYIFRAECTCPDGGTFEIVVRDGRVADRRPLDAAAEASGFSPGDLDAAFDDLEVWFTDSADLIAEGILEVDVRMDPQFGYPRWFRVVAQDIDDDTFQGRFEVVVTVDLVNPGVPIPEPDPVPVPGMDDRRDLDAAIARWKRAELTDYRFVITLQCMCPQDVTGPFQVTVRDGVVESIVWLADGAEVDTDVIGIWDAFDLIAAAIETGTDVAVTYHDVVGYPMDVIIDPEAVAVDGGLAFSIEGFEPLGDLAYVAGKVVISHDCPGVDCRTEPVDELPIFLGRPTTGGLVPVTEAEDGTFFLALEPGDYDVTGQTIPGYLQIPNLVQVTVVAGTIVEIELTYGTEG